jgi:hypothetical protein
VTQAMTRTRLARVVAFAAAPTLSLTLVAGTASATTHPYFVSQNTPSGASIEGDTGTHELTSQLRAVAGDGSVHVLAAKVTPSVTAAVLVNDATGAARIAAFDPYDTNIDIYAGNGAVVVRENGAYRLLDVATGSATALAALPTAPVDNRDVTAATATADGALVATADSTPPGTSGAIHSVALWKLTPGAAEQLASFTGKRIVAIVATQGRIDVLLASNTDDALSLAQIGAGTPVEHPMNLKLNADVTAAELAYAEVSGTLVPLVALLGSVNSNIYNADGELLESFTNGTRIFVSAKDVSTPITVSNKLSAVASLTGVTNRQVLAWGAKVTPVAGASVSGIVSGATAAVLTVRTGSTTKAAVSGSALALAKNTCFTASSAASLYVDAANGVTACVSVRHRLVKTSYRAASRKAVVSTTASQLQVQVYKSRRWVTVKTLAVKRGAASFTAPRGKVRVNAPATVLNVANTLQITTR